MATNFSVKQRLASMLIPSCGLVCYFYRYLFPRTYRKRSAVYRDGAEIPVSEELTKLVDEVTVDIKMTKVEVRAINPYMSRSYSPGFGGELTTASFTGFLVLGIPAIFLAQTKESIPDFLEKELSVSVDWTSEMGQQLMQNCMLSRDAKKFAVAEVLYDAKSAKLTVQVITTGGFILSTITACQMISMHSARINRIVPLKLSIYMAVAAFKIGLLLFCNDIFESKYQRKAEKKCSSVSNTYAEAGLEYKRKTIEKNIILRKLLKNGNITFNKDGSECTHIDKLLSSKSMGNIMEMFSQG